ncbi:MAG: hypothetical protein AB7G28_18905 [Pirellulales bacterium]
MRLQIIDVRQAFMLATLLAVPAYATAEEAAPPAAAPAPAADAPVADPPAADLSTEQPLQQLDWLLGEWTGMTDNATVLVSSEPCEGGAFIERHFVVKREGQPDVGGTQRIGWDPVSGRIKCWTFDTLGGFGEGYWYPSGDSWVIESDETLADGSQSTTTAILTPKGEDKFEWQVERARVNGASLPQQTIEFVRAK